MKRIFAAALAAACVVAAAPGLACAVIAGSCLSLNKAILTEQTEQAHIECDGRSGPMK